MTQPLRIAVFVGAFPVASETFILRQITGLLDFGHDVRIFANTRGDTSVIHDAVQAYRLLDRTTFVEGPADSIVWEMPLRPLTGHTWLAGADTPTSNLSRLAAALPVVADCARVAPALTRQVLDVRQYGFRASSWSGGYRLATLLRAQERFDVLHAHFGPVANAFRFARELFQAPLVVSFHGYDYCTVPRKEGRDVYRHLWPAADRVIANSNYTREQLLALGCPDEKLTQLPVGLDVNAFCFRERVRAHGEPVRLLTVARLVEIKGHEFVLRALAELRPLQRQLRYDIVGDGPLRGRLTQLTRELGLESIVTFHGTRSSAEVTRFLSAAHVFVLTSVNIEGDAEGQGLAVQEAQACGLPVIATQHGAFPEGIAPEHRQWLVPERDVRALAGTLEKLIASADQWPALGRAGRRFVEARYDITQLNRELVNIYRRAQAEFRP